MKEITLTVNKADVYDEVAKTTSYTGVKMQGDEGAYERIFTTDGDRLMLERFWVEACNASTEEFKPFITSVSEQSANGCGTPIDRNYVAELELSSSFDETLRGSIESSLFSFFVASIVSKWYKFTNKEEQASYAADAVLMMQDVMSKLYFRKKPKRIVPA